MQHSVGTHFSVVVWLRALMGLEMEMRERDGTRRVPRLCLWAASLALACFGKREKAALSQRMTCKVERGLKERQN